MLKITTELSLINPSKVKQPGPSLCLLKKLFNTVHLKIKYYSQLRASIPMGQGDTSPNIWTRGHYHECPPLFEESRQVIFICWFHGILFYQNTYFTLILTKNLQLLLLGDFILRPSTMALPLDSMSPNRVVDRRHCLTVTSTPLLGPGH